MSPARPRAEACRYLVQGTPHKWRLADAGLFGWSDSDRESIH